MENKIMGPRPLEFILNEGDGHISRDVAKIPAGTGKLKPGTVLGELTAAKGSFIPSPATEVAGKEGAEKQQPSSVTPLMQPTAMPRQSF